MDCYFLDSVPWQHSQALYHAAAHLGREALFILRPSSPYVCIGYHQDAEQEIDLEFTAAHDIPVFRREVGGGAVYLDSDKLFYQLILNSNRSDIPANKAEFYRKFLQPVIQPYREFGVAAEYKPVNDIIAGGRKISGNGAAQIEGMLVLVGNFILDFNYDMMSKVLCVPDEKFRDKVYKTLSDNLSTFRREIGFLPATADLAEALIRQYEPLLGRFSLKYESDAELLAEADELFAQMYTPEWLYANDRRRPQLEQIKIREGVYVIQNMLKTPGGLVRIMAVKKEGFLHDVHIAGDFFFYPAERLPDLERALIGLPTNLDVIAAAIQAYYNDLGIESPGLQPIDIAQALLLAEGR